MTLKTASMIDLAYTHLTGVLVLPLAMLAFLLTLLKNGLDFILNLWDRHTFRMGNRLLMMSDAVKDGTIKNAYCLHHYTASKAWAHLKEAKKSEKEDAL